MKLSPSVALYLAGMSELVSAESKFGNYTPVPHVMQISENLNHEICSRSVDRVLHHNFDFNPILKLNSGDWTDEQFTKKEMYSWEDMPATVDNSQKHQKDDAILYRMSEMFKGGQYSLFGSSSISPKDAMQGTLGDCWIQAAASSVASDPERIKKIFLTQNLNSAGIYALRFYILGVPVTVSVDELLPFKDGVPIYANAAVDGALWMPVLEKAAAKMYGNYEML